MQVSYTHEANGRLLVSARIQGHKATFTTRFFRENSMPDQDMEPWEHHVQEELPGVEQ